jgi:hypothetical protein
MRSATCCIDPALTPGHGEVLASLIVRRVDKGLFQ